MARIVNNLNSTGLKPKDCHAIQSVLARHPKILEAFLYGSRAIGTFKPNSDIDLALKGHLSPLEAARIKGELEDLPLPYKFDVLVLDDIRLPALRQHVEDHGQLFFVR